MAWSESHDEMTHDGLFGGWETEKGQYQKKKWMYEGVEPEAASGGHAVLAVLLLGVQQLQIGIGAMLVAGERHFVQLLCPV